MVAQGKVQELVDKGEAGFLEMLKEVTGTAQFDQKIEGMNSSVREAQGKKTQLQQVLLQIREKLGKLEEEIEVYAGYDSLEKDKKALERCLYAQKMQLNMQEIEEHRKLKRGLMAEREELVIRREEYLRQGNMAGAENSKVELLRDGIAKIEHKIHGLQQVRQEIMNKQMAELESFGNLGGQQSTSLLGRGQQRSLLDFYGAGAIGAQSLAQQLAEVSASIQQANEQTEALEGAKEPLVAELRAAATKLALLEKDKDDLLLQREAAQNTGSTAQISRFYKEEQTRLQVQSAQAGQDLLAS